MTIEEIQKSINGFRSRMKDIDHLLRSLKSVTLPVLDKELEKEFIQNSKKAKTMEEKVIFLQTYEIIYHLMKDLRDKDDVAKSVMNLKKCQANKNLKFDLDLVLKTVAKYTDFRGIGNTRALFFYLYKGNKLTEEEFDKLNKIDHRNEKIKEKEDQGKVMRSY